MEQIQDISPERPTSSRSSGIDDNHQVYRSRWYILGLFGIIGVWQNLVYSTFGPIAQNAVPALGLTQLDLALLPNWANISFVLSAFPYVWLVESKGLRMPMTVTIGFCTLGAAVRCLHTGRSEFDKIFLHLGQLFNGLAGAVPWFGCTHLSAVWFSPGQRTLATTIGLFAGNIGVALSFLIGPAFVHSFKGSGAVEEAYVAIYKLLYFEFLISTMLLLLTIYYFPSKPPTPPSFTASIQRISYARGFQQFATNPYGWVLFSVYTLSSIFTSWSQFLAVSVKGIMEETEVGWLGFTMTMMPTVMAPILSTALSMSPRLSSKSRIISVCLVAVACGCIALFVVAIAVPSQRYLLTKQLIWGTIIPGIALATAAQPVWWEMACDCVYPVPESIASGIFSVGSCTFSMVFLIILMFPSLGSTWIHWVLLATQATIIPLLLAYRHSGNRSSIDSQLLVDNSNYT